MDICLASTLHDPERKLNDLIRKAFIADDRLSSLFSAMIVEYTFESGPYLLDGWYTNPKDDLGNVRRRLIEHVAHKTNCDIIFFVDMDRLLYWWLTYPGELEHIVNTLDHHKFTVFGRTEAAFSSHPWIQRDTEAMMNRLFGWDVDILAACRGIPAYLVDNILAKSKALNPACIDAEWPMIVGRDNIRYIEVNGLGYESMILDIQRGTFREEVSTRMNNLNSLVGMLYG